MTDEIKLRNSATSLYWALGLQGLTPETSIKIIEMRLRDNRALVTGQLRAVLVAVLDKRRSTADVCRCERCAATLAQAQADGWRCDLCGYSGTPLALGCACYDHQCSGGRSAGSGCPHGGIICPACDDGDGDFSGWDVIRELRAALAGQGFTTGEIVKA